jgi:hypothetical protein
MFLRHLVIKKLEDFFYRSKYYTYAHVPRPLGSVSSVGENACEAYIYEWAFGSEGFAWELTGNDGQRQIVLLRDWPQFVQQFDNAGINVKMDRADPDDGRISKNIIHQYSRVTTDFQMNPLWKRIDYGWRSVPIDFEKLSKYLSDNAANLMGILRSERVEMLRLAVEYLSNDSMSERDKGRLESMVGQYRASSLLHYTSRGEDHPPVYFSAPYSVMPQSL